MINMELYFNTDSQLPIVNINTGRNTMTNSKNKTSIENFETKN